jgi:threonine/homoserine/homoserine lactone efflux protein
MAATRDRDTVVLIAIAVLALLALVYSVFIARALLQWVGIVLPLVFLYLAWRFVRAHERIATALESDSARPREGAPRGAERSE